MYLQKYFRKLNCNFAMKYFGIIDKNVAAIL